MTLQSKYCFSVAESTTMELSKETLRSLLGQIESELYSSEVYQRTLAGLETMLGDATESAQILVRAVGREAIRLAFGQFVQHHKFVPTSGIDEFVVLGDEINFSSSQHSTLSPYPAGNTGIKSLKAAKDNQHSVAISTAMPYDTGIHVRERRSEEKEIAEDLESNAKPPMLTATSLNFLKSAKKPTKAELAAQMAFQEREEHLRQIGQEIKQARQARSLTLRQLHNQTLVQTYYIEALENGCTDKLPEDIYVRGFIRLLGNALGFNGVALANSLPAPDPAKSVLPSWYRPKSSGGLALGLMGGFQLSSVHLYLGYTALVASSVGGLAWMSQQSTAGKAFENNPAASSHSSVSQLNQSGEIAVTPGLKQTNNGIVAGADIAPPEAF